MSFDAVKTVTIAFGLLGWAVLVDGLRDLVPVELAPYKIVLGLAILFITGFLHFRSK